MLQNSIVTINYVSTTFINNFTLANYTNRIKPTLYKNIHLRVHTTNETSESFFSRIKIKAALWRKPSLRLFRSWKLEKFSN